MMVTILPITFHKTTITTTDWCVHVGLTYRLRKKYNLQIVYVIISSYIRRILQINYDKKRFSFILLTYYYYYCIIIIKHN